MKTHSGGLGAWVVQAAVLVYREVLDRTHLLAGAIRGEEFTDGSISSLASSVSLEESLAAYAEPASLPEPLLRSKVG